MATTKTGRGTRPCPHCGAEIDARNLARHIREQHDGGQQAPATSPDVDAQIAATVKPLKETLRGINKRLEKIADERARLLTDRKRIEQVLKVIDPSSFVATPKSNGRGTITPAHVGSEETRNAKRQLVLDFMEQHREQYADGFTAAGIYRDMRAAGVEPISAPNRILRMVEELHAQGVIRADRKIRGGAMQYKMIGNGGNQNGEA